MKKKLTSIGRSLLGLLYDALASVGRGAMWLLNRRLSAGVSSSATCARNTYEVNKHASTMLSPSWSPAKDSLDGTSSSLAYLSEHLVGKSYAQNAMIKRQNENVLSEKSQGMKYDASKPPLDLIPVEALNALGEVLAYGARKYDRANWAKGIQQSRLIAAALRHLTAYSSGQDLDPESGLSHVGHALCNLAFLAYMQKNRPDMDDRWSK